MAFYMWKCFVRIKKNTVQLGVPKIKIRYSHWRVLFHFPYLYIAHSAFNMIFTTMHHTEKGVNKVYKVDRHKLVLSRYYGCNKVLYR